MTEDPSTELALYLADTSLAAGLQYGLWVEKAPSTEEQVALSSMSQDKLGHARAFYQVAEKLAGRSAVELQYERDPGEFKWNPAFVAPLPTWNHLMLAQALFGPGLMLELEALREGVSLREPLKKIHQEETWHERHAEAWLRYAAGHPSKELKPAFEDLWPFAVGFFGQPGGERFPEDVDEGVRASDDELRSAYLDEVVPRAKEAGLDVPAESTADGWSLSPEPDEGVLEELQQRVREHEVELIGLLQDPAGRAIADLA